MSESRTRLASLLFPLLAVLVLWPRISAGVALIAGILLALTLGNPFQSLTRKWTHTLLALSVVGLGAGMDLRAVARAGLQGLGYTVVSISASMALGLFLARRFRLNRDTGLLVTVGTAICGGSAIAAVAPVIQAEEHDTSVALATVFLLNAVALLLFPVVGHALSLSQHQFGIWAALAIHDTSSVVGAGQAYGPQALLEATTVKLARALWIVPVAFAVGLLWHRGAKEVAAAERKAKKPWFILGFLAAAALATYIPALQQPGHAVAVAAQRSLVLTLFFIGANLTPEALKKVGLRPFLMGVALWLLVAGISLAAIRSHLVS
ncbi:MAG TPA: putative sulfate exporter family transporter [Holophagaceae bacterium]|nr:putative sulfate exporter family transporter [Holophagaceae bacterium]